MPAEVGLPEGSEVPVSADVSDSDGEGERVPIVNPLKQTDVKETEETAETPSVRENLAERQQADPELGLLIELRLRFEEKPSIVELSTKAEGAKRLLNQCDRLEVHEGSLQTYRR